MIGGRNKFYHKPTTCGLTIIGVKAEVKVKVQVRLKVENQV